MTIDYAMSILAYGETKVGKSTLAVTGPYPRLYLDVEAAARFLPGVKVKWDPRNPPPVADGTWDTCVVPCRDFETMLRVYQWLQLGQHQFKSVAIDSVSELQVKCLEQIAGRGQVQTAQWGELLRAFTGLMRDMRDLTEHPTNPIQAVILTAMAKEVDGVIKPYIQGQSGVVTPFLFDIVGYIALEEWPNPDPTQPPYKARRMYVERTKRFEAGERVQGRLGTVVEQNNLNVEWMLNTVFPQRIAGEQAIADAAQSAQDAQAQTTEAPLSE